MRVLRRLKGQHYNSPWHAWCGSAEQVRCNVQIKPPARNNSYEEEHQMVPCAPYKGAVCGGGPSCQPFRVMVAPAAQLMMDFHAHLSNSEVIGILGGSWDEQSLTVR